MSEPALGRSRGEDPHRRVFSVRPGFGRGSSPELPYARWSERALASLVDALLLAPALAGEGLLIEPSSRARIGLLMLGILGTIGVYDTLLQGGRSGQTLGKRLFGIAVRAEDGGPCGYGGALLRFLALVLFGLMLPAVVVADWLWPLADRRRQSLHDKFARTMVVSTRRPAP